MGYSTTLKLSTTYFTPQTTVISENCNPRLNCLFSLGDRIIPQCNLMSSMGDSHGESSHCYPRNKTLQSKHKRRCRYVRRSGCAGVSARIWVWGRPLSAVGVGTCVSSTGPQGSRQGARRGRSGQSKSPYSWEMNSAAVENINLTKSLCDVDEARDRRVYGWRL